jgi:hypothetical protein
VERVPARAGARNGGVRFLQCATRRRVKGDEVRARTSLRAGWDAGPGLMQRLGEAGGSRGAGLRTKRWEQPRQRDGRAVLPDARARASTTERQSESEPVVEAPSFAEQPQSWRTSAVCSNDRALEDGRSLQARAGLVAGEMLRLLPGCAAGVEPAADPVKRSTVNVGSAPNAPSHWWLGKARCRLLRSGRGRVRVVVRGRESRPHGEGGQQGYSIGSRLGGRT